MLQKYFRAGFQKRFSPGAAIRGTLARYLQFHDWDLIHDRFVTMPTKLRTNNERVLRPNWPFNNLAIYLTINKITSLLIGLAN